jgi:protein O-GlcNAc transferase
MYAHDPNIPLPQKQLSNEPQQRQCRLNPHDNSRSRDDDGDKVSFVYCSFNKHLKFDPDIFTLWLTILQNVPNSLLCLLENPLEAKLHLRRFISEHDPALLDRVRWLPFVANPYDNFSRIKTYCNAVLDTQTYNGHTTTYDALWSGVPVVTYDGPQTDYSARIGISTMHHLGIPEMITQVGSI